MRAQSNALGVVLGALIELAVCLVAGPIIFLLLVVFVLCSTPRQE